MTENPNITNEYHKLNLAKPEFIPFMLRVDYNANLDEVFEGGIVPVVGQKIETVIYAIETDRYGNTSYKARFRAA